MIENVKSNGDLHPARTREVRGFQHTAAIARMLLVINMLGRKPDGRSSMLVTQPLRTLKQLAILVQDFVNPMVWTTLSQSNALT